MLPELVASNVLTLRRFGLQAAPAPYVEHRWAAVPVQPTWHHLLRAGPGEHFAIPEA